MKKVILILVLVIAVIVGVAFTIRYEVRASKGYYLECTEGQKKQWSNCTCSFSCVKKEESPDSLLNIDDKLDCQSIC